MTKISDICLVKCYCEINLTGYGRHHHSSPYDNPINYVNFVITALFFVPRLDEYVRNNFIKAWLAMPLIMLLSEGSFFEVKFKSPKLGGWES